MLRFSAYWPTDGHSELYEQLRCLKADLEVAHVGLAADLARL